MGTVCIYLMRKSVIRSIVPQIHPELHSAIHKILPNIPLLFAPKYNGKEGGNRWKQLQESSELKMLVNNHPAIFPLPSVLNFALWVLRISARVCISSILVLLSSSPIYKLKPPHRKCLDVGIFGLTLASSCLKGDLYFTN